MNTPSNHSEIPNTSTEASTVSAPELGVASGSAVWLRKDAADWEGVGRFLGFIDAEDEQRNAERVAGLRTAADRLEKLENFVSWMRKRTDEANKFNAHTTLSMFLRKLDELQQNNPVSNAVSDAAQQNGPRNGVSL